MAKWKTTYTFSTYFLPKKKIWAYLLPKKRNIIQLWGYLLVKWKQPVHSRLTFCQKIKSLLHFLPENKISVLPSAKIYNFGLTFCRKRETIIQLQLILWRNENKPIQLRAYPLAEWKQTYTTSAHLLPKKRKHYTTSAYPLAKWKTTYKTFGLPSAKK